MNELPGGEAAQGVVFTQDSKTVIVQFDVERAEKIDARIALVGSVGHRQLGV